MWPRDARHADRRHAQRLVTDLDLDVRAVSKLYRERGDCENVFDEMKNQWGWGGFVTRDLKRTAIVAGLSAFVANLWNMFCRLGGDCSSTTPSASASSSTGCIRLSWTARSCCRWPDQAADKTHGG